MVECWRSGEVAPLQAAPAALLHDTWLAADGRKPPAVQAVQTLGWSPYSLLGEGGGVVLQVDTFTAERYSPHSLLSSVGAATEASSHCSPWTSGCSRSERPGFHLFAHRLE
jgi:hypothetical protein